MKHFMKNIKAYIVYMKFKNNWENGLKSSKSEIAFVRKIAKMKTNKPKRNNLKENED